MGKICFGILLLLGSAVAAYSQGTANSTTTTVFVARTGLRLDSPHVKTYHYMELFQVRGKWVFPDAGYIDFARGSYREVFAGMGRIIHDGKRATVISALYFDQALGPAAKSARYLQPWAMLQLRFTPKLTGEVVYFPYLPLNQAARIQHVLERTKIEYSLSKSWKLGAGYGGYKFGDASWQNKPFITVTASTKAGALEIWIQKMPRGAQVQLRYKLVHTSK